jgi:hypothetical protein
MCDLDILIVIRDRQLDKVTKYTSGSLTEEREIFTVKDAAMSVKEKELDGKNMKSFTDDDYEELRKEDQWKNNQIK